MSPRRSTKDASGVDGGVEKFAVDAARTASELKCSEILLLDLRGLSQVCDFIVIASGTSERQMRSVAEHLEKFGKDRGSPPYRSSRSGGDTWVIVDFVDVVVHLFEPEQRAFYDLEGLWPDAPRVKWRATAASER